MLKWIIGIFIFYSILGWSFWYFDSTTPISEQIDVKTMALVKPDYIFKQYSVCQGNCTNRGGSSWGGGSGGGK